MMPFIVKTQSMSSEIRTLLTYKKCVIVFIYIRQIKKNNAMNYFFLF